jgi:hypothetical protein
MNKENENSVIFIAYNYEHIQVFKTSQTFKQVFTIFNNPIEEINIENESEDIKEVKNAIDEYIKENNIKDYKCYIQF